MKRFKKNAKQQTWRRVDSSQICQNFGYDSLYEIDNSDAGYTPSPLATRLLSPKRYTENHPHDAVKGTCRRRTLGVSLVTYIAYTTRSIPSTIFLFFFLQILELALGFNCSSKERWTHFRIFYCSMTRTKGKKLPIYL